MEALHGDRAVGQVMRVDLHAHTDRSPDGRITPEELVERALEAGLDRIAVTDHGTIDGALRARESARDLVIVGEEIRCRCGTELIGLFLREAIPQRLALEEVVERIRDQQGVVYAPHPYAYARQALRRARRALKVADVVEGVNARAFLPVWNHAARRAARQQGLPVAAGSDAHFGLEIGRAYTELDAFAGAREFRKALPGARPVLVRRSSPYLHVASVGLKWGRLVGEWTSAGTSTAPAPSPAD